MEKDYTASNIRAFRLIFRMTQEQLGAAIGFEKNTISMYENGSRNVDSEKRKRFADYFGISVSDLTSIDYSTEKPFNIDETAFNKYIYKILPVFKSESALKNEYFRQALTHHKNIYVRVKNNELNFDYFNQIIDCLNEYEKIINYDEFILEAKANYIALWFLLGIFLYAERRIVNNNNAVITLIMKKKPGVQRKLDELIDDEYKKDIKERTDEMKSEEETVKLLRYLTELKKSSIPIFSELAYYYLALRYVWNGIENELDEFTNQRVAIEMMTSLSDVQNKFAKSFLEFNNKSLGK